VRDQIRDKPPYPFEDMGEQSVKNIARPVRAYAMVRLCGIDPLVVARRRNPTSTHSISRGVR